MPPGDDHRDVESEWPACRQKRTARTCRGVRAGDADYCLQHLDPAGRKAYLAGLKPGDDLDLRGVEVGSTLLAEVLGPFRDQKEHRFVFGSVRCDHTRFTGQSWFNEAVILEAASFEHAVFSARTTFDGSDCMGRLSFRFARFDGAAVFEMVRAAWLDLKGASFAEPVRISAEDKTVVCDDARFEGGLTVFTTGVVSADRVHFGGPSLITRARVTSLRGTDVSNLVLTETDLSVCRLLSAHRLEQVRIDGKTRFAEPEKWWAARRRMLFEEGAESPARVAVLYRALRKSFEDSKYEAGAGDFYYGEMECRRHSTESPLFERVILWFYWVLSGYGQRASRALGALVVVVAVVTGLLSLWGQDFGLAARTALGAVVFRDDRLELTAAGEWTVLVARFLGPVLLALAVLAVRARVKR